MLFLVIALSITLHAYLFGDEYSSDLVMAQFGRRGIDVVRNKIKMFAQKKVTLPPGRHKVVILDEADRWGWPHFSSSCQHLLL